MAQMRFRLQQGAIPHGRGHSTGWYHLTNSCEYDTGRTANYVCREVSQEICNQEKRPTIPKYILYAMRMILSSRVEAKEALEEIKPLVVDFLQERGLTLSEEKNKDYTH